MVAVVNISNDGGGVGGCQKTATFTKKFTLNNSDMCPYDLTGFSAKMQVRQNYNKDLVVELSTVNGKIAVGGEEGTIILTISSAETATLPAGSFMYDLYITNSEGITTKLFEGEFIIYPSITV